MLYGGQIKEMGHVEQLRGLGLDFGEVVLRDHDTMDFWRASDIRDGMFSDFFFIAHGPFEGPPMDLDNIRNYYVPAVREAIETARDMAVSFLSIHFYIDYRYVPADVVEEKIVMLKDLVGYGSELGVRVGLENLSEHAQEFLDAGERIPELLFTLDVGHAQIRSEVNASTEIIARLGNRLAHVHVHDNRGGCSANDDLHLPIGEGIIDYPYIIDRLVQSGYDGTITLELTPEEVPESLTRLKAMVERARNEYAGRSAV